MKKKKTHFAGQQAMQLVQNGGVNDAVNFAVSDFYKAAQILSRCSDGFKKPWAELPVGVQSFVSQQIFRMNAAGQMLDALGYQDVTEVLAALHKDAIAYIKETMSDWNKMITEEGEVEKIWAALAIEQQGASGAH